MWPFRHSSQGEKGIPHSSGNHIRVETTTRILPRCEFDLTDRSETPMVLGNWLLEAPADKNVPVAGAHVLVKANSPVLKVHVLNTTEEEVKVYVNTHIATAEQVEVVDCPVLAVSIQQENRKEEMLQSLVQASESKDSKHTKNEQDMFLQLLRQYRYVFASTPAELGCTDKLQQQINIEEDRTIRQYNLSVYCLGKFRNIIIMTKDQF